MSGNLLRTAVYANPTTSYFAPASGGGGSTVNTQTINCSTIMVNQGPGFEYGLSIMSGEGLAGTVQIVGDASASLAMSSGGNQFSVSLSEGGSLYLATGSAEVLERNNVQIEQRDQVSLGKTSGVYVLGHNEYSPYVQLAHREEIGDEAFPTVTGSVRVGGALLPSSMNIALEDGSGNNLATLTFNENGLVTGNMEITNLTLNNDLIVPNLDTGGYVRTQQASGLTTQHEVRLFNSTDIDLGQLMPMASIRNSSGGLEYASDSKIAQFGLMAPGSNYMTIPPTTYASACNVVLAPYTTLELYTSAFGSGGSSQYDNIGNAYFSTFTAEPYLNGNTFNSYKMFFGN